MEVTGSGETFVIDNIAISTAVTPISFANGANTVLLKARTSTIELRIYQNADGTGDYFTIPAGTSLNLDLKMRPTTKLYIRTSSSTDTLEIITIS